MEGIHIRELLVMRREDMSDMNWRLIPVGNLKPADYNSRKKLKAEANPYAGKIICGHCNKPYIRKTWKSGDTLRKVWQCQERYKVKGIEGCSNRNIDESIIEQALSEVLKHIRKIKKSL